jgi:2'-5' RNA ligase
MLETAPPGLSAQPWFEDSAHYESALVFKLPDSMAGAVERARAGLSEAIAAPPQMEPHLTICYLTRATGAHFAELWARLAGVRWPSVEARVEGFGTFERQGSIGNLHLRVGPNSALREAHGRALAICLEMPWFIPNSRMGLGYVPHVSVFDQITGVCPEFVASALRWEGDPCITLGPARVFGLRIDPILVTELK